MRTCANSSGEEVRDPSANDSGTTSTLCKSRSRVANQPKMQRKAPTGGGFVPSLATLMGEARSLTTARA